MTGLLGVIVSFQLKPAEGWGWMLANGLVTVLLGVLIGAQWPLSGVWAAGTLGGVNQLMTGASLVSIGSGLRRVTK